jgi:hypothetical protein
MDRTADLGAVLGFVISRIEEQAMRSGEPLSEEQRFLLNNLPHQSDTPEFTTGDPEFPLHFVPRDTTYERLCALAKAAHRSDVELTPGGQDWEFAFNVSKLNRHPMCWLLQWAAVKQRRPWWDRWLLVVFSLLFIIATIPLLILVMDRGWVLWRWAVVGAGYSGLVLFIRFVSRRIEERQLEQNIERCRSASRFVGTFTQ